MLLHVVIRNANGNVDLDKIDNDEGARRLMSKAVEKGAVFIVCHHKVEMPQLVDARVHEEAVKASNTTGWNAGMEAGLKDGRTEIVVKLAAVLGADEGTDEEACFAAITEIMQRTDAALEEAFNRGRAAVLAEQAAAAAAAPDPTAATSAETSATTETATEPAKRAGRNRKSTED